MNQPHFICSKELGSVVNLWANIMFCHQIPMHIINRSYTVNSFIIHYKIINISI